MAIRRKKIALAVAGIAAPLFGFGASQTVLAQERADNAVFEEVLVTAQKRSQSIYEVPVAVSAFTGETLERQGIFDLNDIGKFVPNLNVTGFSAGHTSSANPFIRGIGLQDHLITTDPGVGVYVDGVYLGRQVGQNWSLSNIERVEVLRGPQGTLYGRNSIGGAINIITRQPGDEEIMRGGIQVGTRARVNADFYTNTQLTDTVAVSVVGAFKRRDGVGDFKNIDTNTEVGELQDTAARVAVKWTPTDRLSLVVAADGNDGQNGLRPYTTLIDEIPTGGVYQAGYRNSDLANDPYDNNTGQNGQIEVTNQAWGISLTGEYEINDNMSGKMIVSTRHSEYESGLDDDSFEDDFLSFPETGEADQTSAELQLIGNYEAWDFVGGLYYFEEDGDNNQDPTVFLGGPGDFYLDQDLESWAVFGNVGYNISDSLRVSGGFRYTEDEKNAKTNINSSLIVETADRDWDEVSGEAAISYDWSDNITVYGTVQSGYQSGQFPPRPFCLFGSLDFTQPGNVSTPNCFEANDNVTATNYEVGLKGTPLNNLKVAIAVFYTEYEDLPYQVSTTSGAGFDTQNIVVDQDSTGVEWESSWAIVDNFVLHTTIGWIDVDVDDPVAEAPLTPELTASISPEYTMPLDSGAEIVFRADYSYRDEMLGEPVDDPGRFTDIDSRDIINFDISYRSPDGDWTLGLYGRNVTDEEYDQARLNTNDYVLIMLNNDASEFGVRFVKEFN
jgi:iron complex outermembrane receptor protein